MTMLHQSAGRCICICSSSSGGGKMHQRRAQQGAHVTSQTSPTKRSSRGRVATALRTLLMAAGRLVGSATSRLMHTSCMAWCVDFTNIEQLSTCLSFMLNQAKHIVPTCLTVINILFILIYDLFSLFAIITWHGVFAQALLSQLTQQAILCLMHCAITITPQGRKTSQST